MPGERLSARNGLERNLKGYREIRADLERSRKEVENIVDVQVTGQLDKVGFYKSAVGTRYSQKIEL